MSDRLTAERLREVLFYNEQTGLFTWHITLSNRAQAGEIAGRSRSNGYVRISVDRHLYAAHRLAWLYVTGEWPKHQIDHINGVRHDNRWLNLREATSAQNKFNMGIRKNNTSGFKGVSWHAPRERWVAYIRIDGRTRNLGYYDSPYEAHEAYRRAADSLFGEFANYGVVQ